jgi:hypothetical protein
MRTIAVRGARIVITCAAIALAHGCAAEPPGAPAKSVQAAPAFEPEPSTVEEAQAQLDRALSELRKVTPGGTGAAGGTVQSASPPATSQPTTAGVGGETRGDTSLNQRSADARCQTGCRAIASMRRAVAALCRLAGEQDTRCTDARRTLGDSETKVAGCGCGP